jgi:hypothetical protein
MLGVTPCDQVAFERPELGRTQLGERSGRSAEDPIVPRCAPAHTLLGGGRKALFAASTRLAQNVRDVTEKTLSESDRKSESSPK